MSLTKSERTIKMFLDVIEAAERTADQVRKLERIASEHDSVDRVNSIHWSPEVLPSTVGSMLRREADLDGLRDSEDAVLRAIDSAARQSHQLLEVIESVREQLPSVVRAIGDAPQAELDFWTVGTDRDLRWLRECVFKGQPADPYPSHLPRLGEGVPQALASALEPICERLEFIKSAFAVRGRSALAAKPAFRPPSHLGQGGKHAPDAIPPEWRTGAWYQEHTSHLGAWRLNREMLRSRANDWDESRDGPRDWAKKDGSKRNTPWQYRADEVARRWPNAAGAIRDALIGSAVLPVGGSPAA